MTTRHRRLVGRAHRRRAQGVPVMSFAVAVAYSRDQTPALTALTANFDHALRHVRTAWATIRDTVQAALRSTQADYVLVPPLPPIPARRRPGDPLIHNGRKPR